MADAGSRLLFKFRSGTHGFNEELGRHRGREGNKECDLCGNECESVSHVLWECPTYSSSRADFLLELHEKLGNEFECFDSLDSLGKSSFILGSELWEDHFDLLLALVKDYVVNIWESHKLKLYSDDSSQSLSSTEDLGDVIGFEGHSSVGVCQRGEPDTQYSSICMNVSCSAYETGCAVNDTCYGGELSIIIIKYNTALIFSNVNIVTSTNLVLDIFQSSLQCTLCFAQLLC